jgi:hypothetical protein
MEVFRLRLARGRYHGKAFLEREGVMIVRARRTGILVLALLDAYALCGCSSSVGPISLAPPSYVVGGTVRGLAGSGLTLNNDAGIPANGTYPNLLGGTFLSGQSYDVTVTTQPTNASQTCAVSNGTGTVSNTNVTNVLVTCTTNDYTVGGSVTGLAGSGLVLLDNASDRLGITSAGTFTFAAAVPSGAAYNVTIAAEPVNPAQTCSVTMGSGTVTSADVTTVAVAC